MIDSKCKNQLREYSMSTASKQFLQLGTDWSEMGCVQTLSAQSSDNWTKITYGALFKQSAGFAQRLYSLGLTTGRTVALWSTIRPEIIAIEQAILGLGGIVVQVDPQAPLALVLQQLGECQVDMLIVDHEKRYLSVEDELDELYTLVHILSVDSGEEVLPLTEAAVQPDWFKEQILQRQNEEPAFLRWLDGPNPVVVTQQELLLALPSENQSTDVLLIDEQCVRFLPFCWVLRAELYASIVLLNQPLQIERCLENIRPTILVLSPTSVHSAMDLLYSYCARLHPWMKRLVDWAFRVEKIRQRQAGSRRIQLQSSFLGPMVKPVLGRFFGLRVRCFVVEEEIDAADILAAWTTCVRLASRTNPAMSV